MAVSVISPTEQFFDNSGNPLNGGTVTVYDAGTTNLRNIYSDTALSVAASNPVTLDSAGRASTMLYTAAGAYKLVIKTSADVTLVTRDNIDPGVPLGTGVLAVENGGTGGATAAAARASLGAVGTSDIEDLESQVAALAGAAASSEKTQIATGSTAQRPTVTQEGQIRRNTTIPQWEGYDGTGWRRLMSSVEFASAANVLAMSSSDVMVKPSTMVNHPGVAKAWAKMAAAGTVTKGYNVTSAVKNATGDWTVTLSVTMADSNYKVTANAFESSGIRLMNIVAQTTTTIRFNCRNADGNLADPSTGFFFDVHGELA